MYLFSGYLETLFVTLTNESNYLPFYSLFTDPEVIPFQVGYSSLKYFLYVSQAILPQNMLNVDFYKSKLLMFQSRGFDVQVTCADLKNVY